MSKQETTEDLKHVKISVELEIKDDWPPVGSEGIWAIELGNGLYQIDNVPFFAPGIALGDIVLATLSQDDGRMYFSSVHQHSGNFTLVVGLKKEDEETHEALRAYLKTDSRYKSERGFSSLYAISSPIEALDALMEFLTEGTNKQLWEFITPKYPTEEQWGEFDKQQQA